MSVRAPVGPVNFAIEKACIGRGLAAIRPSDKIDRMFLFYWLLFKQEAIKGNEGAVFPSISKKEIENIELVVPPIPEQKGIVTILDEAFAGIATAAANTEKNLANARELFETTVVSGIFGDPDQKSWKSSRVEALALDQKGAIRTGPFGSQFLHCYFLYHPVAREYLDKQAKGSIMAGLNMGIVKSLPVRLPNLEEQAKIARNIEDLKIQVSTIESVYERKLTALVELKQSLLQKAFSGELTACKGLPNNTLREEVA